MPPPAGSGSTRQRLIDAGVLLLDELPTDRLLVGVTTAAVAQAAGVTTGSFFHHFPTATDFVRAVALSYREEPPTTPAEPDPEQLAALERALAEHDLAGVVRSGTAQTWRLLSSDPTATRRFRVQLHLWAHHGAVLHDAGADGTPAGADDVAAVLRHAYRTRAQRALEGWGALADHFGLTPTAPFTPERVATALTALLDGLRIRHAVDPDAVDADLYADLCAVVVAGVHGPTEASRRRTEELAGIADDEGRSPQARSGIRRRRSSRDRIAGRAVGMFPRGWEEVTARDVAQRAKVSVQTVLNLFDDVRGVAALTFARHLPELRAALATGGGGTGDDPGGEAALRAVLVRLAELAADDPEAARALLEERLVTALHAGPDLVELDVRVEVPLAEVVGEAVTRLVPSPPDPLETASTAINFVLGHAPSRPGRAGETAALAVALVRASGTAAAPLR